MISSSNPPSERGLDAMIIVYSLLDAHPASTACEQFIRTHSGWLTTTFTLFEAKAILTKVYAIDAVLASRKLAQFAAEPLLLLLLIIQWHWLRCILLTCSALTLLTLCSCTLCRHEGHCGWQRTIRN